MRIAIIGTGNRRPVSGIVAQFQRHDITVYEADDRIGGHSNTVDAPIAIGRFPSDTGFIVFNDRTYPNLNALFAALDVPFQAEFHVVFPSASAGARSNIAGDRIASLFATSGAAICFAPPITG